MNAYPGDNESQDAGSPRAELAEQARRVVDPDLIERAEMGARRREAAAKAEHRQNRRRCLLKWSMGGVATILLAGAGLYVAARSRTSSEPIRPSLPHGVVLQSQTVSQTHLTRRLMVHLDEGGSFPVQLLVFDQNRFLRNDTVLSNPRVLENALSASREGLRGTWIVVFAAASMEGEPDANLNLCRRRVAAVAAWLRADPGARTSRYWGLPVGEYRLAQAGRQLDEAAEDAHAASLGEERLAKQRQLIIVSIRADNQRSESPDPVVEAIVAQLREAGFLPSDYDFGTSAPASLPAMTTP